MDPLLFGMSADVVGEVLGTIVVLSLLIERALSPILEWRPVLEKIDSKGIKEPVAILASLLVVYFYKFDALAILFKEEHQSWLGYIVTAGIIAGGSKGSIKLFRDFLGWKSEAQKEKEEIDEAKVAAKVRALGVA
jgi:hypothetical protein